MPMSVEVEGVASLVNRLSKFDKDVYSTLNKEIKQGLLGVAADARSNTPQRALRGWGPWNVPTGQTGQVGAVSLVRGTRDLGFRGSAVAAGIVPQTVRRSKRGQVVRFAGRVITKTPAGAIFALAGSRNRSGDSFNQHLNDRWGERWPRTLTDALYSAGPEARRAIEAAIGKAAKSVTGGRV